MTPKVMFLSHSGAMGGAEFSLLDIARSYRPTASVVLLSEGPLRERLVEAGVNVQVIEAGAAVLGVRRADSRVSAAAAAGLVRVARLVARVARSYDLVYANSLKALMVGAAAGALARRPVIWHLRNILAPEQFSAIHRRTSVLLANTLIRRVVANSRATAAAFVAQGGRAGRVRVVPNGIDPSPFQGVSDAEARAVRAALGVGDQPLVGVFSRLDPTKGQHLLIEALVRLRGVHALIVGDALFGETDYAREVRQQARRLGVSDRVHFVGFRTDVPCLMRAVDIVVHPALAPEAFGRVLVEGMLAARPVVATRLGGSTEVVIDGITGLFVSPGDLDGLVLAVGSLVEAPNVRAAMGAAAREHAIRNFSLDAMLAGVSRLIEEVASP